MLCCFSLAPRAGPARPAQRLARRPRGETPLERRMTPYTAVPVPAASNRGLRRLLGAADWRSSAVLACRAGDSSCRICVVAAAYLQKSAGAREVPGWRSNGGRRGDCAASRSTALRALQCRAAGARGKEGGPTPRSPAPVDESVDVALFRFSLGLSFLEDKYVPRAVGLVLGTLVLLNHTASASVSTAQSVTEVVGVTLAALLVVVPSIDSRLQDLKGGRRTGSTSSSSSSSTSSAVFLLSTDLPEASAKELAWASYALVRNTNTSSLLVLQGSQILCARGLWPGSAGFSPGLQRDSAAQLAQLQGLLNETLNQYPDFREAVETQEEGALYLPTLVAAWSSAKLFPGGTACALIQPLPAQAGQKGSGPSAVLLLSDRARAFSTRDRAWIRAIASKLGQATTTVAS